MIVIATIAIAVAMVPVTGGSLRELGHLRLRFVWIVWVCLALQVLTGVLASGLDAGDAAAWLHVATFAPAAVFIYANRQIPGTTILASGGALNLVAIASNGGVMPARPAAWSGAGLPDVTEEAFANSMPTDDAPLWFLGDVFFVPAGWPLANVFSIGDVVLVVGASSLVHAWCRRTHDSGDRHPDDSGDRHPDSGGDRHPDSGGESPTRERADRPQPIRSSQH